MKKAEEVTVDQTTGWPSAVPEMAELERASEAAHTRYGTMTDRLAAAQQQILVGVAKRDALVERTRAGEVVPGIEVANVEIEIRAAESSAALMAEALPSLEAEVEKADRVILALAEKLTAQSAAVLLAAYKRSEAEAEDAVKRQDAARSRYERRRGPMFNMPGYVPDPHRFDEAMSLYAPATLARINAGRAQKVAAEKAAERAAAQPGWLTKYGPAREGANIYEILSPRTRNHA
ncbi:hypothetical protein [Roseomonas haemaphysalidis]|uniref:Uncharacterized protein n=1 Tax=Roseomonas haemaphysalidis TaxID=2768162 RepID=A0ABS3KY56_9PROT|nr:hypothetical protein [Roseomonas haemaphysalidis]MBO1081827.1 hypothetical protein [Roseomonas haemaphysalidis]